ncbi:hypothetical protein ACN47E_007709 [Coniothyrium glycines]
MVDTKEDPVREPTQPASPVFVLTDFDDGQAQIAHQDFAIDEPKMPNGDRAAITTDHGAQLFVSAPGLKAAERLTETNLRPDARSRPPGRGSSSEKRSHSQDEKRQSLGSKFRRRLSTAGVEHGAQDFPREIVNRSFKSNADAKLRQPWAPVLKKLQRSRWTMAINRPVPAQERTVADIVIVSLCNTTHVSKSNPADLEAHLIQRPAVTTDSKQEAGSTKQTVPRRINAAIHQLPVLPFTEDRTETVQNKSGRHWSWDLDILQHYVPNCEIMDVSFDTTGTPPDPNDFEIAAEELNTYLQDLRGQTRTPIMFVGLNLGSLIVIRCLSAASRHSTSERVLSCTAGLYMFTECLVSRDSCLRASEPLCSNEGDKNLIDKLFDLATKRTVSDFLKKDMFARVLEDETLGEKRLSIGDASWADSKIAFPIVQFLSPDDDQVSVKGGLKTMFGGSIRTESLKQKFEPTRRFYGQDEEQFRHFMTLIQSTLSANPLLRAAATGPNATNKAIRAGVDVNSRYRWGQTVLHFAVRHQLVQVVDMLLQIDGVDRNAKDEDSNTPLHFAVKTCNETIILALTHRGADPGIENSHKMTPRNLAEKHRSRRHILNMLPSLLVSGADETTAPKRMGEGRAPSSTKGELACKHYQITVTEIYALGKSDKYWSVNISVDLLLYGTTGLPEILAAARPKAIRQEQLVCTWIHIPENNIIWVEDLVDRLGFDLTIWPQPLSSMPVSLRKRALTPHVGHDQPLSVFLPYISYEDNQKQQHRAEYIKNVAKNHKAATEQRDLLVSPQEANVFASLLKFPLIPLPIHTPEGLNEAPLSNSIPIGRASHFDDSDSDAGTIGDIDVLDPDDIEEKEKAMIDTYLYGPSALHVRRTLDQYYYYMLKNTQARDKDQVVKRWAERHHLENRHNIMMVDQLWLWKLIAPKGETDLGPDLPPKSSELNQGGTLSKLEGSIILTCFPSRTGVRGLQRSFRGTQDDLQHFVLNPPNRKRNPVQSPEDLIARILGRCCGTFDRLQDDTALQFFQMFAESIGLIDDKESVLFSKFQARSEQMLTLNPTSKIYNQRKNDLLVALLDIREEIELLVEIKDIRDEIKIITSVLGTQRSLVEKMGDPDANGNVLLEQPVIYSMIRTDIEDFNGLNEQAAIIQDKLSTLMDLKQKAANAWEAREARETTVAASKQGDIIMVFTVVTIIFLPLTFIAAFFTIDVVSFPKDERTGETSWPLKLVTVLLICVSASVSLPLIIFALNMEACAVMYNELWYHYLRRAYIGFLRILPLYGKANKWREHTIKRLNTWSREYVDPLGDMHNRGQEMNDLAKIQRVDIRESVDLAEDAQAIINTNNIRLHKRNNTKR